MAANYSGLDIINPADDLSSALILSSAGISADSLIMLKT